MTKGVKLDYLAEMVGGELDGEAVTVSKVAPISVAKSGELTFLSSAKNYSSHLKNLQTTSASALIAPLDAPQLHLPSIRVKNPHYALSKILAYFHPEEMPNYKIHPTAFVSEKADVAADVVVGPMAVIEEGAQVKSGSWIKSQVYVGRNAVVGSCCRIFPGVKIMENCIVKDNCIIHANTVIGSDGFGFTPVEGKQLKVPQVGNVIIENDVEIGALVSIDRATMGSTTVGEGTKIDNMVHLAHNVKVGKNCVIVAQVGISGSTIIEDDVTMAGQTGTVGHVTIGRGATVAARGVVTSNVEPGSVVSGFPMKPHGEERRILASLRKLPQLIKRVKELEKKLEEKGK